MFPFIAAATAAAPILGALVQSVVNKRAARAAAEYSTPAKQMGRFIEAGLNPNLIYGQMTPNTYTPQAANFQDAIGGAPARYTGSELQQSQTAVADQKVVESQQKTAVAKAQEALLKNNPFMREEYVNDLVSIMDQTAKQKEHDVGYWLSGSESGAETVGQQRVFLDIQNLVGRNNLMGADAEIKAQIIKSEGFKKELLEVQRNWMKEKNITPQHVYQGLLLLLGKMMH